MFIIALYGKKSARRTARLICSENRTAAPYVDENRCQRGSEILPNAVTMFWNPKTRNPVPELTPHGFEVPPSLVRAYRIVPTMPVGIGKLNRIDPHKSTKCLIQVKSP